jgi:hypothetical protein
MNRVILKAMAKDPDQRFQTPGEMLAALLDPSDGGDRRPKLPTLKSRRRTRRRRR